MSLTLYLLICMWRPRSREGRAVVERTFFDSLISGGVGEVM
jgi:hypothetical protein